MRIVMSYMRHAAWSDRWYNDVAKAVPEGIQVQTVPLGGLLPFPELDRKWKSRDTELLRNYEKVRSACQGADIFFSYGAGIHPEFLPYLSTFNCYFFCDDPEDSPWQSAKVAPSFDAAFYANIASRFQYESWGCRRHSWLPIFTASGDVPTAAEHEKVLESKRSESVAFVGGLDDYSSYRRRRLEKYSKEFPEGVFRGRGWPSGRIDEDDLNPLYLRTRIGFNIHRTTGPINRRMFQLAAHGVMQICDNKTGLGQIFELGKEVVGFDTIDEAIELTKYYLEHDSERKSIARAGYERFWKDYHAEANWARLRDQLLEWGVKPGERKSGVKQKLPSRNVSYFFGVNRKTLQAEAQRLIRSAKAAKREYLRKDPWWKIYERVFTSEAVYLPEYSACGDGGLLSVVEATSRRPADGTERVAGGAEEKEHVPMAGETPALHSEVPALHKKASTTPQDGALRWAMTQLIGNAKRIAIFDPTSTLLFNLARFDPKREICSLGSLDCGGSAEKFDLTLCALSRNFWFDPLGSILKVRNLAARIVFSIPLSGTVQENHAANNVPLKSYTPDGIYLLMKATFADVKLFHMPDPTVPWLEPIYDSMPKHTLLVMASDPLNEN